MKRDRGIVGFTLDVKDAIKEIMLDYDKQLWVVFATGAVALTFLGTLGAFLFGVCITWCVLHMTIVAGIMIEKGIEPGRAWKEAFPKWKW